LQENASMLRYTYIGCLVLYLKGLTMGPQTQTVANQTDKLKAARTSLEVAKRLSNNFHEN